MLFTTLSVTHLNRNTLGEKLHMVRRRRFVSHFHEYGKNGFYTTRLYTYCDNNQKAVETFCRGCNVPVLLADNPIVRRYKYLITANTVFKIFSDKPPDIAVYDPTGSLIFLLPRLLSHSRTVCVYTANTHEYNDENNRIFSLIGAAAVVTDVSPPKNADAIISSVVYRNDGIPVFGEHGFFACSEFFVPDGALLSVIPPDADALTVAAGLYSTGGEKKLGYAYCEKLMLNKRAFNLQYFSQDALLDKNTELCHN